MQATRNCVTSLPDALRSSWQREAELAAGAPDISRPPQQRHLAKRLGAVLKGGAEAIGGDAAAVYLLDEATTCLKLRWSWGLPQERFANPPRPLQSALADLEAMLGHAVVLEDATQLRHWNAPEDPLAAVCLPVSTATTILGTLWIFSRKKRDFSDRETGMLEIVAGRIAGELEREMFLTEGVETTRLKRQLAVAERIQRNQLPTIAPLLDGWELAGWTERGKDIGGDFYDWFCLPNGLLAVAVGCATETGIPAALVANNVKTALRCHAQYHHDADRLLRQVNLTLWTGSAGDQSASLFCGLVETETGFVSHAFSGRTSCVLVRPDGCEALSRPSARVGEGPEAEFEPHGVEVQPGQVLLLSTHDCHKVAARSAPRLDNPALAVRLTEELNRPAKELAILARDGLRLHAGRPRPQNRAILVVKRTGGPARPLTVDSGTVN